MKNIFNIISIATILLLFACNDITKEKMQIKSSNPFHFSIVEYSFPLCPTKDSLMIINYKLTDTTNSNSLDVSKRLAYNFFLLKTKIDAFDRYINSETKNEIVFMHNKYIQLFEQSYQLSKIYHLNINHEFFKEFDIFLSNSIGLDEQMIVAITKSNVIYCLKGFNRNNFIELVNNEIGHAYTDEKAYEIALFYLLIETINQYNIDRGLVVVDGENINKIKSKKTGLLKIPTVGKQGEQKSIEIMAIETSTDKIVKYIFVFNKFYLVKIEHSVINEGAKLVTY